MTETTTTHITVRVIAKGGKFLGADVGGALVTIRDALTGGMLAEGITQGGSGNTTAIMQTPRTRGEAIPTEEASAFTAALALSAPTLLEVTARGPRGGLQSANTVTATQWLIPGKDLTGGDGLLLELPGLVVQVLDPPTHTKLPKLPYTITFKANVTMMCGCPISPGGIWDAKDFEVAARIKLNGAVVDEVPLQYAGTASQFERPYTVEAEGFYEAIVYAYQSDSGNMGMGRVTFFFVTG